MEQRQGEFAQLQHRAIDALEYSQALDGRLAVVIQLWMYPAFEDFVSWTVFADRDQSNPIVKRVIWNRTLDFQRFTNPLEGLKKGWHTEPTMTIDEANLNANELADYMKNGRSIRIALLNDTGTLGLDGTSYGLCDRHLYHDFRLKWWESGPEEWRELTTWAAEMRTYLSQAFASE